MQIDTVLYDADGVVIRLVSVIPNTVELPQQNDHQHTISIPLAALSSGVEFDILRNYLLNYVGPTQYGSLHTDPLHSGERAVFLQILWEKKTRK